MKEARVNAAISITALAAALLMLVGLSYAIGKWSFGHPSYTLFINFPNAAGINPNSEVKFAGAHVGRVKAITLIPRAEQTQDPNTHLYNCVKVAVEIDKTVEIGEDSQAVIKQDGIGIAAKYVLFSPGPDPRSKTLADGEVLQGHPTFELADLAQPAGEALTNVKALVVELKPMLDRLDGITNTLQSDLPPLMTHADEFLQDGAGVLGNLNTDENRQRLSDTLASLRVSSDNLKVVSSNAKALTATLAEKPWRVFWGGPTIPAPSESAVLKSDKPLPLKRDVEVGSTPAGH